MSVLFVERLIPLFYTSTLGSKPGWRSPGLPALSSGCNRFLGFTAGVTPADFLVASMEKSDRKSPALIHLLC